MVGGHSQFFRAFLGAALPRKMDNVEVVACDFDCRTMEVSNVRSLLTHNVADDDDGDDDDDDGDDAIVDTAPGATMSGDGRATERRRPPHTTTAASAAETRG